MNNYGIIEYCENHGNIKVECTNNNKDLKSDVYGSGIAVINYGIINNSKNFGSIVASSINENEDLEGIVFAGGISAMNYNTHTNCINQANIEVYSKQLDVFCGGISGLLNYNQEVSSSLPLIEKCGSAGNIDIQAENPYAFGGGLCGRVYRMGEIKDCYSLMTFERSSDEEKLFFGTAIGCVDIQYSFNLIQGYVPIVQLNANKVYVLSQEVVKLQIGGLIYNGVSKGGNLSPNITSMSETEIKSQGVYWV